MIMEKSSTFLQVYEDAGVKEILLKNCMTQSDY